MPTSQSMLQPKCSTEPRSCFSLRVHAKVLSQMFETVMGAVIAFNIGIMVIETNADATCYSDSESTYDDLRDCSSGSYSLRWLQAVNITLLVIYTVECFARAFVERSMYFWNRWNQIDLLTVVLGWAGVVLSTAVKLGDALVRDPFTLCLGLYTPLFGSYSCCSLDPSRNLNVLRLFRVVRLMRAARVATRLCSKGLRGSPCKPLAFPCSKNLKPQSAGPPTLVWGASIRCTRPWAC